MQISGKFRGKTALFLSSTVGLALTLAGCTSVEYTAKEGPDGPKITTVAPSAATGNTPATATPETAQSAAPAGTTAAPAATTATADASLAQQQPALPNVAAVKGGRVALPPAAEIAAAAAIVNQMQPTAETQVAQTSTMPAAQTTTVALAPTAATPAVAAVNAAAQSTHPTAGELPQVVAVKGSFPPAPPPPGSPSIGTELTAERKVIPLPKPDSTVLAYAAGPTNAALAAVNASGTMTAPLNPSPAGRDKLSGLISKYAAMYQVPEDLVHRVVQRESRYNPAAYNGGHFGLMQIKHATARSMGFDGPASGLFDAETNLRYAVKYLRGAWLVADNDRDNAVRLYARGYYYDAKRKGMLHVLRK